MQKQKVVIPEEVDEYTLRFWFASLEASWKGTFLRNEWNVAMLNWPYLLWAGRYHRVLASFGRVWERIRGLPEAVYDELWIAREMAGHCGKAVLSGIQDLKNIAQKHFLKIALMKSPCYLLDAFSGFEDREVRDIDVLVSKRDLEKLSQKLHQLGYESRKQRRGLVFRKGRINIDARLEATNRRRFWKLLPSEQVLGRAEIDPRWRPLLKLSTPDEALVLVLHAYHHCYRQAIWIRDIAVWWKVRNPDPAEILTAFQHAGLTKTGWVAWLGMEQIGWQMPKSWHPQLWGCKPRFNHLARFYWDRVALRSRDSLGFVLLTRWLEFQQAKGIESKLRSLSPWFSLRNLSELYRAWKSVEKEPGKARQ